MGKRFQNGLIMENSVLIIDEKKPGIQISARIIQILAITIGSWSAFSVLIESMPAPVNINVQILLCAGIMFALCVFPSYDLVKLFFTFLFYGLFFYSRLPQLKNGFFLVENLIIKRVYDYYQYSTNYYVADGSNEVSDITLLMIIIMIPMIGLFTIAVVRNRLVNLCSLILFLPVAASFLLGVIPSEKYLVAYIVAILYLTKSGLPYKHINNREQRTLLQRINSRSAVWVSLLALTVFFILKLFISEDKYDNIAQLNDMKSKVQQTFMETSLEDISERFTDYKLFKVDPATGGLLGGELGNIGKVNYTGDEQLVVKAIYSSVIEGLYLKGYVGSDYTGNRWVGHNKEDESKYKQLLKLLPQESFSSINQTNKLLNLLLQDQKVDMSEAAGHDFTWTTDLVKDPLYFIFKGSMQIEYKGANKKYIYAPYYTDYEQLNRTYNKDDLYAAPYKRNGYYNLSYYFNVALGGSSDTLIKNMQNTEYTKYEKAYREYVYDVYTKMPEKGLNRLKKDFSKDNASFGAMSLTEKLDYVKNYLAENTQYTLSPGELPKGKDFVEYFLYENKKGYCSHYASAATLMLRAMGVPARYVEGYSVGAVQAMQNPSEIEQSATLYSKSRGENLDTVISMDMISTTISVRDYNAHAWIEIYMDGCGWIPMDFTPGSAIAYNTQVADDFSYAEKYLDQKDDVLLPTIEPQIPTQAAMNQEQAKQNQDLQLQSQSAKQAEEDQKARLNIGFIIAFILMTVAAAVFFLIVRIRRRRRIRNVRNRNKRAIFVYSETEKILYICKGLPGKRASLEDYEKYVAEHIVDIDVRQFATFMEIVKKARYGRGSITVRELGQVEKFSRNLYAQNYDKLPFYKRLTLKMALLNNLF